MDLIQIIRAHSKQQTAGSRQHSLNGQTGDGNVPKSKQCAAESYSKPNWLTAANSNVSRTAVKTVSSDNNSNTYICKYSNSMQEDQARRRRSIAVGLVRAHNGGRAKRRPIKHTPTSNTIAEKCTCA